MPSKLISGGDGIRITFKDGKVEDFVNQDEIVYFAEVWISERTDDKTSGELSVGFWDFSTKTEGEEVDPDYAAFFQAGSYAFVRTIVGEG